MSQITGSFPVIADGNNIGNVKIEQNGLMTVFDCVCHFKSHDVLRLAAVCDGKYVPLGVMVPEKTALRLKKSFSKKALSDIGYTESTLFHLIKQGDVYTAYDEPIQAPPVAEEGSAAAEEAPPYASAVTDSSPGEIETDSAYQAEIQAGPEPVLAVSDKEPDDLPSGGTEPIVYNDFPEPTEYVDDFEPEPNIHIHLVEPDANKLEPDQFAAQKTTPEESDVSFAETAQTAPSGWTYIPDPRILFNDTSVIEACQGVYGAYITEQDGCVLLAVPVLPNEPFPMMPVFCFGYSGEIGGQEYVVFKIRNGNLTL